ncbi:M50 family metallopeptidase [Pontibacter anaerobius]|uniref:M50 family metallopeptidase n=1 Tax=Pontibacter anaerobius TaxID=2993940 RepID=A0ABT3RBZ7_9BACT|nr:M50 family metallopeptidase [Pontibacter anaerobius]MCX2739050.1 M50 family metallopeptidase [Pontibacter anaerobius]
MFGINDLPKFLFAFFLVLPIISFVHEAGHVFFAWLMGGKNIRVTVGSGRVLFQVGILEVRQYYFWYGLCTFDNLKRNQRFAHILIFAGGSLFNGLAAVAVVYLIENEVLEAGILTYQFTYFSLYYVFFALLPMPYPDGNYSDGKVIIDLIRNKAPVKTYRVQWNEEKKQWCVLDHDRKLIEAFEEEEQALSRAHEVAKQDRPSRLVSTKSGKETEVQNYPKVPL